MSLYPAQTQAKQVFMNAWTERETFYRMANYRQVLEAWLEDRRKNSRYFSWRSLAKRSGFSSPNYFQLVLSGKRNLGFEGAVKLSQAMKLTGIDREYFLQLVEFDRNQNYAMKKQIFETLLKLRERAMNKHDFKIAIGDYEYLSNWVYVALREYLMVHPHQQDLKSIAKAFRFEVSERQISDALTFLERANLIEKTSSGFRVLNSSLASSDEEKSLSVRTFHEQMLKLSADALQKIEPEDREFGALSLAVTASEFTEIKQEIKDFLTKLCEKHRSPTQGSAVCHIGVMAFPLTR